MRVRFQQQGVLIMELSVCVCICVHDDSAFLPHVIKAAGDVRVLVAISKVDWNGVEGNWKESERLAIDAGADVFLGEWTSEENHRAGAYEEARRLGFTHAVIADSDEIIEPKLLESLKANALNGLAERVYVEWDTYWFDTAHVVRPRERFTPCILINLTATKNVRNREFEGGRALFLGEEHGIIHHLSYVGPDSRIEKKVRTWGHKHEVVPGWYERSWCGWQSDPLLHHLHPTHPQAYEFVEHIETPAILQGLVGGTPQARDRVHAKDPKLSVCMPLYGGQSFIRQTLAALESCRDLLHEVIVVDNASPDGAADIVAEHNWITLLRNGENRGFGAASNQAYEASTGDTVLFLNSDAIVTRDGLIELASSLYGSGTIGAAAPLTNFACTEQAIRPCLTDLANLPRFAADVAGREVEDTDSDFLIGFCLAVKRPVLEELGAFDERFVTGGAEDTELCYRLRRSGYRLVVSQRSYIHHLGSQTFGALRELMDVQAVINENDRKFHRKWASDVESGFASHLSGLSRARIVFDESKRPNPKRIATLAKKADISLCMIVKNEERVLRDCLDSAKPYFREMLVLDTGSTDRTIEIAENAGAVVRSAPWQDSFSLARTESMKHAKGKWIMCMDADDTLPEHCAEAILNAIVNAPDEVMALVVPVRFVEREGFGTTVDHVKVFRNFPGLEWEGRIHEQILGSLKAAAIQAGFKDGGLLSRIDAYVLHSGYDNSPEGQARKRERDYKLLKLDLRDSPNHPFRLFNMGMTEHYTGNHASAVKWLRKSIRHSVHNESHLRKAYGLLGSSLRALGKNKEAEVVFRRGLNAVPGDPEIQFWLAQFAAEKEDFLTAVSLYEAVLVADVRGAFTSIDPGILGYKTRHNLAMAYLGLERYEEAKRHLQESLAAEGRMETALALFEEASMRGDLATCSEMLGVVRSSAGYDSGWAHMVGKLSQMTGLDPSAHYDAVLRMHPENLDVCKALALHLLNLGQDEASIPHLDFLQSRGIPEGAFFLGAICEQAGDLKRALGWYERALQLNPSHIETALRVQRLGQLFKDP
ncbi:MAG TPA: tetratricopeptide repeat protein [Fimbriimonadaceae bacterium]|nr:tetratricopeptide repeat protein [Fimbriimonadaceae bacterium]